MSDTSVTIDDLAAFTHSPRLVGNLPVGAPVVIEDQNGDQYDIASLGTIAGKGMVIKIGEPRERIDTAT